jgi:hypothetical protein
VRPRSVAVGVGCHVIPSRPGGRDHRRRVRADLRPVNHKLKQQCKLR